MGLLDGLRGDFEKTERRGDQAIAAGEPLQAWHLFREALNKASKKDPAALERLREKAREAHAAFLKRKLDQVQHCLEEQDLDSGREALDIAREHLGPVDEGFRPEMDRLEQELKRLELQLSPEEGVDVEKIAELSRASAPLGAILALEPDDRADDEARDADSSIVFEQLAVALPDADREHGLTLGSAFHTGYIAQQRGDFETARQAYERAVAEHPDDPLVLEQLAFVLDTSGQPGEATQAYSRVLQLDPSRRQSRLALAGILAGVEASAGSRSTGYWLRVGGTAPVQEGFSRAIELLEGGVQHDADHAATYLGGAAEIGIAVGRYEQAARYAARALESGGAGDPSIWHLYASARELSGDVADAEEAYRRATQLGGAAMFYRAEFAEFALRHSRALADAETLIFNTCMSCQGLPSPEEVDAYGLLLTRLQYARGEYKQALQGLDRLIAKGVAKPLLPPLMELREAIRTRLSAAASEGSAGETDPAPAPEEDEEPERETRE